MSLAMFIYSPAKESETTADAAGEQPSASAAKASQIISQKSTITKLRSNARGYSLRPRSIAFPTTIAVAILVLILSLLKSTIVSAGSESSTLMRQDLGQCQTSELSSGKITCPLDLFPGLPISSARILIESQSNIASVSTCTLFARSASGGQARGVTIQADHTDESWAQFPKLSTRHDDFRYVTCDLAQGASIGGLEVTVGTQSDEKASQLKAMIKKNIAQRSRTAPVRASR